MNLITKYKILFILGFAFCTSFWAKAEEVQDLGTPLLIPHKTPIFKGEITTVKVRYITDGRERTLLNRYLTTAVAHRKVLAKKNDSLQGDPLQGTEFIGIGVGNTYVHVWDDKNDAYIGNMGITVKAIPELAPERCGGVDDTDRNNATEACVKMAMGTTGEAANKYFSSSPSIAFLAALGYIQDDSYINTGRSYSGSRTPFAKFNQSGLNEIDGIDEGVNGQYDRYCKDLASLDIRGRSNWRRVTEPELRAFLEENENEGGVKRKFGFPSHSHFLSSTPSVSLFSNYKIFKTVRQFSGNLLRESVGRSGTKGLAMCVSEI